MVAQWILPAFIAIVANAYDMPGGLLLVDKSAPISSNATDSTPSLNVFGLSDDPVTNRQPASFNNGGHSVLPRDDDHIGRLFKRAPCPAGYGPCSNNPSICCPAGGKCCVDGNCCSAGYDCVFVSGQTKLGCCRSGTQCAGSSPCQDAGYVLCSNYNFCCLPGYTCYLDSAGARKCRAPSAPTPTPTYIPPPPPPPPPPTPTPTYIPPPPPPPTPTVVPTPTFSPGSNAPPIPSNATPSAATIPSSTPDPVTVNANTPPVGAIVGGVVGGFGLLALLGIGAFFYFRKRRTPTVTSPLPAYDFAPQMQSRPGFAGGFNPEYSPQPGGFHPPSSPTQYTGQPEIHDARPEAAAGAFGAYRNSPIRDSAYIDPFSGSPPPMGMAGYQQQVSNAPNLASYGAPVSNMPNSAQEFYPNTPGNSASFYGGGSTQSPTPVSGQFGHSNGSPTQPFLPYGAGRN